MQKNESCVIKAVFCSLSLVYMFNKAVSFFKKEKEKRQREWEGGLVHYHLVRVPEIYKFMSHQISQGKGY